MNAFLKRIADHKRHLLALMAVLMFQAQSFAQSSITVDPEDLDPFFEWFSTFFDLILPIALIGAGIAAGAAFAFLVGQLLRKAFQSLGAGA